MIKLFLATTMFCSFSYAIDSSKCSKMLNEGWYKTYKWGGVGESVYNAITQETKRTGSTTAASNTTTEGTTAVVDPGYSTNISTSETQSTSSWGECSLFALKTMQKQQELYVDQNHLALKRQIALNQDGHIQVLATLNLCEDGSYNLFKAAIREQMPLLIKSQTGAEFVTKIKQILSEDKKLNTACFSKHIS